MVTLAERSLSTRRIELFGSGSCWVVGSGRGWIDVSVAGGVGGSRLSGRTGDGVSDLNS